MAEVCRDHSRLALGLIRPAGPVVRVARSNGLRAVNLLDQHNPYQHMRPCERAERQGGICALQNGTIQPFRPANNKAGCAPRVLPCGKAGGKGNTAIRAPTFIQRHNMAVCGAGGQNGLCLTPFDLIGLPRPSGSSTISSAGRRRLRYRSTSARSDLSFMRPTATSLIPGTCGGRIVCPVNQTSALTDGSRRLRCFHPVPHPTFFPAHRAHALRA